MVVGLAGSSVALGAEEGASSNPMSFQLATFIAGLVVFGIFAVLFSKLVAPRIVQGLADRENKIRSEIKAAEEARRQAAESLKQYERSLAEARAEAQAILERTRADQQKFASELRAKADAELTVMRERAMRDIESARREAMNDIYSQAVTLASEIAGKILKREVSPADHARLLEESIGELETARR